MRRRSTNGFDVFEEATDDYVRELEAALKQRRHEMKAAWKEIDEGWEALRDRMGRVGVQPAYDVAESIVKLDVGGAPVDLWRSSLCSFDTLRQSRLGALFKGTWDKRLPKAKNGRIVLDESPSCFKYLINRILQKGHCSGATNTLDSAFRNSGWEIVSSDDEPYLWYVGRFLELGDKYPQVISLTGGSSRVLTGVNQTKMLRRLKTWLGGNDSIRMKLLYRASRDGFTPASFHRQCDGAGSSVTFISVRDPSSNRTSIVGGFSGTSWATPGDGNSHVYKKSPGAFIFLLQGKDGVSPETWMLKADTSPTYTNYNEGGYDRSNYSSPQPLSFSSRAVLCGITHGAAFGERSLWVHLRGESSSTLEVHHSTYNLSPHSTTTAAFLALSGARIADVEVFAVDRVPSVSGVPSNQHHTVALLSESGSDITLDNRSFGTSIAACLARERRLLDEIKTELHIAKRAVEDAEEALEVIYGPLVASGKEDPVVELNVRGRSLTTLLSTLLACPGSALAARFDGERWPPSEKDLDSRGRYLVDCDPVCFGKILDVLRIRKRISWRSTVASIDNHEDTTKAGEEDMKNDDFKELVVIPEAQKEAFNTLVNMYFPGCEDFISDLVDH